MKAAEERVSSVGRDLDSARERATAEIHTAFEEVCVHAYVCVDVCLCVRVWADVRLALPVVKGSTCRGAAGENTNGPSTTNTRGDGPNQANRKARRMDDIRIMIIIMGVYCAPCAGCAQRLCRTIHMGWVATIMLCHMSHAGAAS